MKERKLLTNPCHKGKGLNTKKNRLLFEKSSASIVNYGRLNEPLRHKIINRHFFVAQPDPGCISSHWNVE